MEESQWPLHDQPPKRSPFDDPYLYDVLLGDYRSDLDFHLELAGKASGPVLEIACGTGRILIPCLQAGVDIDGIDLSAPMLQLLREKAARLGLSPAVYEGDMRDFSLPRRYACLCLERVNNICICAFRASSLIPGMEFPMFLSPG